MTTIDGLNADFEDLLVALSDEGAEFLVVGAFAVAVHGVPRATGDLDVLVRPEPGNADRVYRALVRFGAPVAAAGLGREDLCRPGMVYQVGLPPRRIDILTEITGVTFDEAWATRVPVELGRRTIAFLGREALLRNKRAAGRAKDLADVERLTGREPERSR
jgi:hypothetical protein